MKFFVVLLIFISLQALQALEYKRYIKTYDGDTVYVDLMCSEPLVCNNIGIRFLRIDCPEIRNKDLVLKEKAKVAKVFTQEFIKDGFVLSNCKRDAYFRLDCEVYNTKGVNLNTILLENGMCKESKFK